MIAYAHDCPGYSGQSAQSDGHVGGQHDVSENAIYTSALTWQTWRWLVRRWRLLVGCQIGSWWWSWHRTCGALGTAGRIWQTACCLGDPSDYWACPVWSHLEIISWWWTEQSGEKNWIPIIIYSNTTWHNTHSNWNMWTLFDNHDEIIICAGMIWTLSVL